MAVQGHEPDIETAFVSQRPVQHLAVAKPDGCGGIGDGVRSLGVLSAGLGHG